ncbi:bifunctional 5,10-methylenetetrahydrofolate dehydrogenase/5,10-methenyltetrahydrofolate cyclohydrolase [Patescibacteria group bacterium]|nr:bifunctional 5,10-methylenetetrahydrofolate dehydrogenase/5,10-methenyltetrahydrofolate cyclohydrolase [Patescibacteria group bacterium]
MKVDGKKIAEQIFEDLKQKIILLKKRHIIPHLAIILVGNNPASISYVNQKKIKSEYIGAKTSIYSFEDFTKQDEIEELVKKLNVNPKIHGIIIQRPLPQHIDEQWAKDIVIPEKDIDGFLPNSKFIEPIAEAVLEILKVIHSDIQLRESQTQGRTCFSFNVWLKLKNIVVVGKGPTGGKPVINLFRKLGIKPLIVDSKTLNPGEIIKSSEILISTVGRDVIRTNEVKKGAIVIGIGMHKKREDGKLYPDYVQEEIAKIASYYTPVPGGVGPINVAMLLKNLILAIDPNF